MSTTLVQAQTYLTTLEAASASGMLSVSINGRHVSYRTMDELLSAIRFWQSRVAELQRTAAGGSRHNFGVASFGSGR